MDLKLRVLNLLKHLQKKLGMAILLITHDLSIVKKVADKVAVMIDGEIVETNSVTNLFAKPKTAYARKLINSEPTGEPEPISDNAGSILEVKDLRVWFPIQKGILKRTIGYIKAVNGVTLSIREGETLGVVGESGSGKTTLCSKIAFSASNVIFSLLAETVDNVHQRFLYVFLCLFVAIKFASHIHCLIATTAI